MIDGVKIKELKVIPDDRGELMEMMRCDEEFYNGFGQVYMSTTYPGVIKGWHYHKLQEDNMVCMKGDLMVGLFDNRENSPTKGQTMKIFCGTKKPLLIHIPIGILHGWKNIGTEETYVVNVVTKPYNYENPDEFRVDPRDKNKQKEQLGTEIPFDWERHDH